MLSTQEIDQIINNIIEREGGYVNHPKDPGGETKYGISKRSYPGEDIKNLTRERAAELYRRDFIDKFRIAQISNPRTAEFVVDWVVHSGSLGIRKIQQYLGIKADGIVGTETLKKLEQIEPRQVLYWRLDFLLGLTGHPFIKGWVNRLRKLGL